VAISPHSSLALTIATAKRAPRVVTHTARVRVPGAGAPWLPLTLAPAGL